MFAHNYSTIDAGRPTISRGVSQLKDDFLIFSMGYLQEKEWLFIKFTGNKVLVKTAAAPSIECKM